MSTAKAAKIPSCRTPTTFSSRARSGWKAIGRIVAHLGGTHRDRLLDRQFLSPAVGYGFLGAGVRRLGLPEPHHRLARLGARPLRISRGRRHGEPASDGRRASSRRWTTGSSAISIRGPPEERNIYQAMEAGKQVRKLPMTLGDALAALEKDEVIRSALPGEMYRLYDEYKRDEWERFLAHRRPNGISKPISTACRNTAARKPRSSSEAVARQGRRTRNVRNCRPHSP